MISAIHASQYTIKAFVVAKQPFYFKSLSYQVLIFSREFNSPAYAPCRATYGIGIGCRGSSSPRPLVFRLR